MFGKLNHSHNICVKHVRFVDETTFILRVPYIIMATNYVIKNTCSYIYQYDVFNAAHCGPEHFVLLFILND